MNVSIPFWRRLAFFSTLVLIPIFQSEATQIPDLVGNFESNGSALLRITPPALHHFNEKAPASAKVGDTQATLHLKPGSLSISLPPEAQGKALEVSVFICDDAKTFCLKKNQTFLVPASLPKGTAPSKPTPQKSVSKAASFAPGHFEKATGFWVNEPKKAFAEAKAKKLPLLIDFFGIWCPPCNHLDAVVFRSSEFKAATQKRFIRLKLDADATDFAELKAKYQVQALPTLIFATPQGDEIFRLVGFYPTQEIVAKTREAFESRNEGYADLIARASEGNADARYKAALIALERAEPEKALEWLQPMEKLFTQAKDPRLAQFYRAQLGVAQKQDDNDRARAILEKWLKDFPTSVDSLENLSTLAQLRAEAGKTDDSKQALRQALEIADRLYVKPELLQGTYYSLADIAQTRAGIIERLEGLEAAKSAYLTCAEAYRLEGKAERSAFARGPSLERAYCLGKAGKIPESTAIYKEGIRRFPKEYTFYAGLARLWLDPLHEPKRAAEQARLALEHAYGGQRLKATFILARALELQGDFASGVQVIEKELATLDSDGSEHAIQSMRAMRRKLEAKREELVRKAANSKT